MCHRATNHCMFNDRPGTSWIPLAIYPCSVLPLYPFRVDFRFFICAKRRVWTCDRAKTPALVMDQRLCRMLGTLRVSSKFSPFFGKLRFGDQVLKKTWEARKKMLIQPNIGHQLFWRSKFFSIRDCICDQRPTFFVLDFRVICLDLRHGRCCTPCSGATAMSISLNFSVMRLAWA